MFLTLAVIGFFFMSLDCLIFSVFKIQINYSMQLCRCPVLSTSLGLNKHLTIDGHQALD